jgi:hypothetical protein
MITLKLYDYKIDNNFISDYNVTMEIIYLAEYILKQFILKIYSKFDMKEIQKYLKFNKHECIQVCLFISVKISNENRLLNGKHFVSYSSTDVTKNSNISLSRLNYIESFILKTLDYNLNITKKNK